MVRRMREVYRSAGWPWLDPLEVDLLAAGYLVQTQDAQGHLTVQLTPAGVHALASGQERNRAARNPHEDLVAQVAELMQREGRLTYTRLSVRAPVGEPRARPDGLTSPLDLSWHPDELPDGLADEAHPSAGTPGLPTWQTVMPDVFSVRLTTRPDRLEPLVHEIKVHRSDLLADVHRPAKRRGYLWLAGRCVYVLGHGVGTADDVPPECGVMLATATGLDMVRPAPWVRAADARPAGLPFAVWMGLARAHPHPPSGSDAQAALKPPPAQ
jgi:hypothetical protein